MSGQGAQYVGMADKYLSAPGAMEVFQTARSILGYDLLKLCQKGLVLFYSLIPFLLSNLTKCATP